MGWPGGVDSLASSLTVRMLPISKVDKNVVACVAASAVLFGLGACTLGSRDAERPATEVRTFTARIGIVNHTSRYIYSATVDGNGGGHSEALNAGIVNMCCATLPLKWVPGLNVSVTWNMPVGRKHEYKTKVVDVEHYNLPGN